MDLLIAPEGIEIRQARLRDYERYSLLIAPEGIEISRYDNKLLF